VPITVTARNNLGAHPLAFAIDTTLHGAVEADKTTPRTTVHLHGGNTEAGSDGHPEATFLPGRRFDYHYANNQEATTLWYHDHSLGITRLNVHAGLAGMYLVRDLRDTGVAGNPIGLPSGSFELPLIIQDKMFNANGHDGVSAWTTRVLWRYSRSERQGLAQSECLRADPDFMKGGSMLRCS